MTEHSPAGRPRTIFMGTPAFAATILRRMLAPGSPVEVAAVVTQPDRPAGRTQALTPPPVKAVAREHALPVLQPVTLRRPVASAMLQPFRADLGIVAAYGKILPPEVLAVVPLGYLNVHASLLPRWRGAWPVGAAILAGDTETGVSIMRLDEGMDTGPVLAARREAIYPDDTTATLEQRLAAAGAELLADTIPGYVSGAIVPRPQDDQAATYCRMVRKADGILDWTDPAVELARQVRAMQPWPVASTTWQGKQLRVLKARVVPQGASEGRGPLVPGMVVPVDNGAAVVTGDGWLYLEQVQLEGRNALPIAAFLNGYRSFLGSRLGG